MTRARTFRPAFNARLAAVRMRLDTRMTTRARLPAAIVVRETSEA